MSSVDAFEQHVFHRQDHAENWRKLNQLYGQVARLQNRDILALVEGHRVLDVGAGYGTLTRQLLDAGFDVIGIEPQFDKVLLAQRWYGVNLLPTSIYQTSFPDGFFDTIILREVVFHLDFERAILELKRVGKNRLIVFQGTSILPLRIVKRVLGHHEFNEQPLHYYLDVLAYNGYIIDRMDFRDTLAFPLSGGLVGKQMLAENQTLYRAVIALDRLLSGLLRTLGLQSRFCFRCLISAHRATFHLPGTAVNNEAQEDG